MARGSIGVVIRYLLLLWLLWPVQAAAITLHDLVVSSLPGEPLRAYIPLKLEADESLAQLHITLASAEAYQRRNIPRAELLQGMRLALLEKGEGRARLQLYGEQPWQGESAQLLFIIRWPQGELEQQFTLAAVTSADESVPLYVEVTADETLDEIAIRLSKERNRSYMHMMYALFLANPDAFYRGNMNNLKSGSTLRVPTNEELYRLSDRDVYQGIRQQDEEWKQLRESAKQDEGAATGLPAGLTPEQVAAEGEALRKENEELQQRLKALEQRMQSVMGQVLEYAEEEKAEAEPEKDDSATEAEAAPTLSLTPAIEPASQGGLSATGITAAIIMVLLFAFYIWFSTGHKHKGRS